MLESHSAEEFSTTPYHLTNICPWFLNAMEKEIYSFLPNKIVTISISAATPSSTAAIGENVLNWYCASGTKAKCFASVTIAPEPPEVSTGTVSIYRGRSAG